MFDNLLLTYSSNKIAEPIDNGVDIITAKKDVSNVPTIKGNAPNSFLTGSHILFTRNEKLKAFIDGIEFIIRSMKIKTTIKIRKMPEIYKKKLYILSEEHNFFIITFANNPYTLCIGIIVLQVNQ